MKAINTTIKALIAGLQTKRFHTIPTVGQETVGHHSALVAGLILAIWPDSSRNLLTAAILHDLAEHVTGDIPSTAKHSGAVDRKALHACETQVLAEAGLPLPQLTEVEEMQLKAADILAGMLACVHEKRLGNFYVDPVFENYRSYLQALPIEGDRKCAEVYLYVERLFSLSDFRH